MKSFKICNKFCFIAFTVLLFASCKSLKIDNRAANKSVPDTYIGASATSDTVTSGAVSWKKYFTDPYLVSLIDLAIENNQELNIILQEIERAKSEVRARKGEYLPFVSGYAGAGLDKVSRYTRNGAVEATTDIEPGKAFPEPLKDYVVGVRAQWELDIWKKLRNAKKSAVLSYLATIEGKNFMTTNLVAEIATEYYELLALDNQLKNINQNIQIQTNALNIVKQQKTAAKVTELAVRRFEAQLYNTKSLKFEIQQMIVEVENKINFLVGRFPQPVERNTEDFDKLTLHSIQKGLPAQLLDNRMDIRQAELELEAQKLDVKVAKARFYPSIGISAGVGFQAFNPSYITKSPESLLYSLAGDLVAPLINRNAIKAEYYNANAKQLQAVYEYEKTVLNAYIEVVNQLAKIDNLKESYDFKSKEVEALTTSINISNSLFRSARADYMEVLLTQRDALESQFELIETKKRQLNAVVNTYRALGGGWN
ncbi:MAG: TolC family protein [Flavobacteriales bacterium]|nr:TolC family protein [Flavobacteriales bacterium]